MNAIFPKPVVGIIGGTGTLGMGLGRRWAKAGYPVIIGSRDPARAAEAAALLGGNARGASYADAAASADIIVLTVPFAHQQVAIDAIRPSLAGQLVIDTTVPLKPSETNVVHMPAAGSVASSLQRHLGAAARVASAFHNVPAKRLARGEAINCDVLVFGDQAADREAVVALVEAAGLRGVQGGPLVNSIAAEALTSVLIGIQRHYRTKIAGLQITGVG